MLLLWRALQSPLIFLYCLPCCIIQCVVIMISKSFTCNFVHANHSLGSRFSQTKWDSVVQWESVDIMFNNAHTCINKDKEYWFSWSFFHQWYRKHDYIGWKEKLFIRMKDILNKNFIRSWLKIKQNINIPELESAIQMHDHSF